MMKGTWEQARAYALKGEGEKIDGFYTSINPIIIRDEGSGPEQGKRNDIIEVKRKFDEGTSYYDLLSDPHSQRR